MKMPPSTFHRILPRILSAIAVAVGLSAATHSIQAQTYGIAQEVWTGLGTDFAYPQGASFTNAPANTNKTLTSFTVLNAGTNYGERLRAFVLPPVSGRYFFSIASADWSDLYLSSDETPENRVRIAYVAGLTAQKDYGFQTNQTSAPIQLQAGQRYYIEALHRQSTNKGYLDVRWQLPDDTMEDPIVARPSGKTERLILYRTNVVVAPVVLRQTTNQFIVEGRPVTFSVIASNQSPVSYQWQMDSADIPGATRSTFSLPAVHQALHGGHKFRCVLGNAVANVNGVEITLTVIPDTIAPTLQVASPTGRTGLLLTFSEALDATTAGNIANYEIDGAKIISVKLASNPRQALIVTEPMTLGSTHTLKVSEVIDLGGVPVANGTQAIFTVQDNYLSSVGSTNSLGNTVVAGNGYDVTAGGRELVGKTDQFVYQWSVVGGNFDVEVRVDSLDLTDLLAKAGLMAREDLGDSSRFAGVFSTPSLNGTMFQARGGLGQLPSLSGDYPATIPNMWLRLQREGNIFRGFASSDSSNWTPLGSAVIGMPEYLYLGLAASGRSTNATTVARFRDYASITGSPLGRSGLVDREPPGPSSRRTGLVISEIMHNPRPRSDAKDLEFVEIFNAQPYFEDMSGYRLAGDIDYVFPANTILPGGGYLVVAKAPKDVQSVYHLQSVFGPYSNSIPSSLATIRLINELGGVFQEVQFGSDMPWPISADGAGHSLVLARPSYGEGSIKAWSSSDSIGGSPGRFDSLGAEALRGVVINEFMANPAAGQTEFIELYNHSDETKDLSGAWLSDSPITNKFHIPAGSLIPPHGYLSFTGVQLGFGISSSGESLYFVNASETRVVDAIRFNGSAKGVSQGRTPDGAPALSELATSTPGAANTARLMRDIVINEIMYAPITGDNDDEFVELYNRGTQSVNLAGWKLRDAVTFTFPSNAVVAAKGYIVVGKNLARLLANYTNLTTANTFGNYNGTLANSGDHVVLTLPELVLSTNAALKVITNIVHVVVNEVAYENGGRWGRWSEGGGSSLELGDSDADNRQAANWGDSDESKKAPWTPIEYTGRLDWGGMGDAGMLQLFLQSAGEALIDDVEVFTATNPKNVLANPGFEQGVTGWTFQGTHELTSLETGEGYNSKQSLHLRASGRGDNGGNRVRISWSAPLAENSIGTIRAKVRWLTGTPHMLLRLRGNWLECPGVMTLPKNLGTPGARNTRAIENAGPALFDVTHSPILPSPRENITITARASDPDGIAGLSVFWRLDSGVASSYAEVIMRDDGTGGDMIPGDGIYAGQIPGQGNNAMIAFYVAAKDGAVVSASARFPADAPSRECLIRVGETQPTSALGTYRFWCTQTTVNRWNTRGQQSNHPLDCTFAYNNYRVIYNAATLYSGSPWHTPGYSGPLGAVCDYILHTPPDDALLGAADFVLASIGNTDNDDSKLAEQSSYWIARKMGLPYNYRRHIFLNFNGSRRASSVYEDTQQPNGDVLNEYYPNDSGGALHKIEDWFEFDDSGDTKQGNVDATLANFQTVEGKKVARYRVCWRPRSLGATGNPNDFSELFKIVDALGAQAPEPYNTALSSIIDDERWLRIFAMEHVVGNWDSYGFARGKNMYAYKPTQGRWQLLLWDIDFDLNSAGGSSRAPDSDMFEQNDAAIGRLYTMPLFRRIYFRICKEAADGPLRDEVFASLLDAKYKGLVDNGAAPGSTTFMKDFVRARRDNLLKQVIPTTNFVTIGTNFISTNSNWIVLTGAAPVTVDSIAVNGTGYPVTWYTVKDKPLFWSLRLSLQSGTNNLMIEGLDRFGLRVTDGVRNMTVISTDPTPDPVGSVVINEVSYSPNNPEAAYIELFNRSETAGFDMTGWRMNGASFTFPEGSVIGPRSYVVIAKDQFAFGAKFGFRNAVLGEFQGTLSPSGETLSLVIPALGSEPARVVDRMRYEANAPWPLTPALSGVSLELIDANQDNARVSNWTDDGSGWHFFSATGKAGSSNLFLFITAQGGDAYLDHLSVVAGNQPEVGVNLIKNGDFEEPLAGTWRVASNHAASVLSSQIVYSGKTSLHIIAASGGSAGSNSAISQFAVPVVISNIYTLSYWLHPGSTPFSAGASLGLRFNPGGTLGSTQSIARVLGSPGAPNTAAGILPASYPDLWLNEVGSFNNQGPKDAQGERDPWVELYNAGTTPIALNGYFLSDAYSNLVSWPFPAGSVIQPGELKLVWVDGDADDSTAQELHSSFRIAPTEGTVVLSRMLQGSPQILDYLNYTGIKADESYGSVPEGQPFFRTVMSFPSPGATNTSESKPLLVKINEWMASNTGFLLNTSNVPATADDWFELYNAGRSEADLSGYYLTDTAKNKTQFKIPNGTRIGAGAYLLVWADGLTALNTTNSPELHVNFQLSKSGEQLGLYAPDGAELDLVTFGAQTNNVSQGRLPDGGNSILYFPQPTPRASNKLAGNNTTPVLAKIGNKVIDERKRFTLQLVATDAEESSDQLVFSMGSGAPTGATITPQGLFVWRPTEAQGPGVFPVTFMVNDNGTPSLQAGEPISITVREVNSAPFFTDLRAHYVRVGESVSFGTGADADLPPQPVGFRFDSLVPPGATLDPLTGRFSWTPSESDAGKTYTVAITATDSGSPSLSASGTYTLSVYPNSAALIVLSASLDKNGIVIRWESQSGGSYQVEWKSELGGAWQTLGNPTTAVGTSSEAHDSTPSRARFYRVRKL